MEQEEQQQEAVREEDELSCPAKGDGDLIRTLCFAFSACHAVNLLWWDGWGA